MKGILMAIFVVLLLWWSGGEPNLLNTLIPCVLATIGLLFERSERN
jgi:hypothetical protein